MGDRGACGSQEVHRAEDGGVVVTVEADEVQRSELGAAIRGHRLDAAAVGLIGAVDVGDIGRQPAHGLGRLVLDQGRRKRPGPIVDQVDEHEQLFQLGQRPGQFAAGMG